MTWYEKGDLEKPTIEDGDRFRVTSDWLWVICNSPRQDLRIPVGTEGVFFADAQVRGIEDKKPYTAYTVRAVFDTIKNPNTLPLGPFFLSLHLTGKSHYDHTMELIQRSLNHARSTPQMRDLRLPAGTRPAQQPSLSRVLDDGAGKNTGGGSNAGAARAEKPGVPDSMQAGRQRGAGSSRSASQGVT